MPQNYRLFICNVKKLFAGKIGNESVIEFA